MLARVSKIMEQLVHAWDVLATMTPPEYSAIRPYLANSSGFQSWQYRCIEFRWATRTRPCSSRTRTAPTCWPRWRPPGARPSLYDEALRLLARRGLPVPASHLERDWTQPYEAERRRSSRPGCRSTATPQQHWDLYQLGEELTDLEDAFRLWRFRHVTTVERVIGFKRGTGGTSGVGYLRKMLLFPEIWSLVLFPEISTSCCSRRSGPAARACRAIAGPCRPWSNRHHATCSAWTTVMSERTWRGCGAGPK
jgi:tryptophan 2,3-dioxygenase